MSLVTAQMQEDSEWFRVVDTLTTGSMEGNYSAPKNQVSQKSSALLELKEIFKHSESILIGSYSVTSHIMSAIIWEFYLQLDAPTTWPACTEIKYTLDGCGKCNLVEVRIGEHAKG